MTITCVVPSCRPGFIPGVVAAIRAQSVKTRIVVVENGPAEGACSRLSVDVDATIKARHGSAPAARNAGLALATSQWPGDPVSFFDDDDIYLPGHLATLIDGWDGVSVRGRADHYLKTRKGCLYYLEHLRHGYVMVQSMIVPPGIRDKWDESLDVETVDVAWCKGRRLQFAAPEHFAFNNGRWDHLWAPDDREWAFRCPAVYDLGRYDRRVVAGDITARRRVRVEPSFDDLDTFLEMGRAPTR